MLGIADLAAGLAVGRPPRASGSLALHVLDILEAILTSGETGAPVLLTTTVRQPQVLEEDEARAYRA